MACDTCQERRLPQGEIIAAHAVKFAKRMIAETENDSCADKWGLLKSKIAEFDVVADAILGAHVLVAIDDADYLTLKAERE